MIGAAYAAESDSDNELFDDLLTFEICSSQPRLISYLYALKAQNLSTTLEPLFDFSSRYIVYPSVYFFAEPTYELLQKVSDSLQTRYMPLYDASAVNASWQQLKINCINAAKLCPLKIQTYRAYRGPCGFIQLKTVIPVDHVGSLSDNTRVVTFVSNKRLALLVSVDLNADRIACSGIRKSVLFDHNGRQAALRCPICGFRFYNSYYGAAREQNKAYLYHLAIERMRLHGLLSPREDFEARWRRTLNEMIIRALLCLTQHNRKRTENEP